MTCRTRLATVLAGVSECQSIRLPSNDSLSTQWGVSEHVGRRAIQSMDGWVGGGAIQQDGRRYNLFLCFAIFVSLLPKHGRWETFWRCSSQAQIEPSCFVNIAIGGFVVIFCNLQFRRLPPKLMTAIKSDLIKC